MAVCLSLPRLAPIASVIWHPSEWCSLSLQSARFAQQWVRFGHPIPVLAWPHHLSVICSLQRWMKLLHRNANKSLGIEETLPSTLASNCKVVAITPSHFYSLSITFLPLWPLCHWYRKVFPLGSSPSSPTYVILGKLLHLSFLAYKWIKGKTHTWSNFSWVNTYKLHTKIS